MTPVPRPEVAALPRYSRATGAGAVRWVASSNESALPPSPRVVEAVAAMAGRANRYPSLLGEPLSAAVADGLGVPEERVVVGGGSLALLQLALTAYTGPGTEVVYAWRSYEAYPICAGIAGARPVAVPLTESYEHDLDAMLAAVTPATRAVLLCDPNNPTGTELGHDRVAAFLDRLPPGVLVLLDQAYQEFATRPVDALGLLDRHPNLAVLRTFSKAYGLAGLRAGYLIASPAVAETVRAVAPPFGLNAVAEAAAVAAWSDPAHTATIVRAVRDARAELLAGLAERGIGAPPSGGNFVWLPVGEDALRLERACVARGVSVRAFPGEGVRVTAGEPEVTRAVLTAIDDLRADRSH